MTARKLKIFFHVMDLVGPQNACIGLGQILLQRGHQVCFLINEQFANRFTKYGFVEFWLKEDQTRAPNKDAIKEMCDNIIKLGFFANNSPLETLKKIGQMEFTKEMYEKAAIFEPQIATLLKQEQPDVIVIDCDIVAPCLLNAGVPFVYLFCSNPLGLFDSDDLPPFTSGFPIDSDRKEWDEYRKVEHEVLFGQVMSFQVKLSEQFGHPVNAEQKFIPHSQHLNIYQYPEELDYHDVITIADKFVRVDAFCRDEVGQFELPHKFKQKIKPNAKLIYVSMGSMGSVDVKLMSRLVSILSKTDYFYIVSKGLFHDQFEQADNMLGEAFLPQTHILPLVDLVITHGGNNSLLEAATFAKPVIVMPLFYDQFTNAQRVHEKGYGLRIKPYDFEDAQLVDAIEQILGDKEWNDKYVKMANRMRESNSKEKACEMIEKLAFTFNVKQFM